MEQIGKTSQNENGEKVEESLADIILDYAIAKGDVSPNDIPILEDKISPEFKESFRKLPFEKQAEFVVLDKFPEDKLRRMMAGNGNGGGIFSMHDFRNNLFVLNNSIEGDGNSKFASLVAYDEELKKNKELKEQKKMLEGGNGEIE